MDRPPPSLVVYTDFSSAARAVLEFLRRRLGYSIWLVTRREHGDWIVLQAYGTGYSLHVGSVRRWGDTLCAKMVEGAGPRVAPATAAVPVYATASLGDGMPIGAYIGAPIVRENGEVFGTLCALDPVAQPESGEKETALVELCATLLSSILWRDLRLIDQAHAVERLDQEMQTDPITLLLVRDTWERMLKAEECRCARYGHTASIFSLDLDGTTRVNETHGRSAGDEYLRRAARSLSDSLRGPDLLARTGADEFSVLALECDSSSAAMLARRLLSSLKKHNVSASLGFSTRDAGSGGLERAWRDAEQLMHRSKSLRRPRD